MRLMHRWKTVRSTAQTRGVYEPMSAHNRRVFYTMRHVLLRRKQAVRNRQRYELMLMNVRATTTEAC